MLQFSSALICLILATLLSAAGFPRPALAFPVEDEVARIQAQYDRAGGFKAYFRQESRLKGGGQSDTAEGWVYFKRPLRMRWQYEKPADQKKEVICDGKQVYMYIPQDSLVMVYPMNRVLRSDLVLRFFSGIAQVRQDFQMAWRRPPQDGASYLIDLTPLKPQAELKRLSLTVNPATHQVEVLEFTNALGEETRFLFTRIQLDYDAPPDFFTFTPPPGVQVVRDAPGAS
jgi:outer membrane lipoprotein carrier protein